MATIGDAPVHDPVLQQRYRFECEGDALIVDVEVDPGGSVPDHTHPSLTERWEVVTGEATFSVAGQERPAGPGTVLDVEPGIRHAFANRSAASLHLRATVTPAMETEGFLRDSAKLHQDGRLTRRGRPTSWGALRDAADFAIRYRDTIVLHGPALLPPPVVQRLLFPLLARRR